VSGGAEPPRRGAKDLEAAVQINPSDFYAWHNYGDLNYSAGDFWMLNDHSNAKRSVTAFTRAIALNPKSARSYMGRGWAYLTMDDQAHANADFSAALQLDFHRSSHIGCSTVLP
jgi:Flp pilus assembly protein TadD